MKKLLILLILVSNYTFSQTSEIDNLNEIKKKLTQRIDMLNDSISIINSKLSFIKTKEIESDTNKVLLQTIAFKGSEILKKPMKGSTIIKVLNERTDVFVVDYRNKYYEILIGDIKGFIKTGFVNEVTNDVYLLKERGYSLAERERRLKDKKYTEKKKEKQESLEKSTKGSGRYWRGMSKDLARLSLGKPDYDNRTVGSWGIHNQWVYKDKGVNLYFENGILTSWQD